MEAALSQFLNYGGLGLLAILCIVVLGYNAWNLNGLIAKAEPERISAARPLLLGQMAISLIGLLAVGTVGIYIDWMKGEDSRIQSAQIVLDPWDEGLDAGNSPDIRIAGTRTMDRPISVTCTPGRPITVRMNLEGFIRHRIQASMMAQSALLPIGAAGAEH